MSNPTCGKKSGFLQTIQNSLLAFNPTTQQFSSDFPLLALHSRSLLKKVLGQEVITGKSIIQSKILYSQKKLEPEEWEPTATILASKHSQHALQINKLRSNIKKQPSGLVVISVQNRAENTLESQELNWPSSLNPNHARCEPGVIGRRPLRDWVPVDMLNTLNSSICKLQKGLHFIRASSKYCEIHSQSILTPCHQQADG